MNPLQADIGTHLLEQGRGTLLEGSIDYVLGWVGVIQVHYWQEGAKTPSEFEISDF